MPHPSQPQALRAFVSSTYLDLHEHRALVIEQLRNAGLQVDPMENWTADSGEPQEFSQQRIEGCDLCVLLVAFRRGCVPPGQTLSITQMEYERARELGLEILPFLLDDDAPWPRRFDDMEKDPALVAWRNELRQRHGVGTFGLDPKSVPLHPALARWLQKPTAAAGSSSPAVPRPSRAKRCCPALPRPASRRWRWTRSKCSWAAGAKPCFPATPPGRNSTRANC